MSTITPSATVGPFFLFGLVPSTLGGTDLITNNLVTADVSGERIRIEGRVLDGDRVPVPDALVEIWQADAAGRYRHPQDARARPNAAFLGFGRAATDDQGRYAFETIKPGAVPFDEREHQAPHICVTVFARGLLNHLVTRLYFDDEAGNAGDPVLQHVPEERRGTIVARRVPEVSAPTYRFDIVLQGVGETVFFNV